MFSRWIEVISSWGSMFSRWIEGISSWGSMFSRWIEFISYWGSSFTLHYITLRHFIHHLHLQWPMVHQQSHSSSPNASLKRWVFKSFLKVSVFVSSWRLDGKNSMPLVRRTRNSARRTLVSTVEVHIGSCWRISVSHDQAGQRQMSSCPTSTQGCDQLAPGAWACRACR